VGATYDFTISGNAITSSSANGSYTDPANPSWCLGPNDDNCAGSGVTSLLSFGDVSPTSATVTFSFIGSTRSPAEAFTVTLGNFTTTDGSTVTGISYASGGLATGSFALSSFDGTTATFEGSTTSNYNAIGGANVVFDVQLEPAVAPIPLPAPLALLVGGLAALGVAGRRRRA